MHRRLSIASLALACAGLAACGSQDEPRRAPAPAAGAAVGCAEGGSSPRALPASARRTSVVSGPLTLAYVKEYAGRPARAFEPSRVSLGRLAAGAPTARERRLARRTLERAAPRSHALAEVLVRVAAGREATLTVAQEDRSSVGLVYTRRSRNRERRGAPGAYRVADGDPAVAFRACPGSDTDFLGGMVVAGSRCAAMTVTSPGRRPERLRLAFGTAGCEEPEHLLRRMPYLGVSCPEANSIACDRVGLAVWLRDPATGVTATVNGRPLGLEAGGLGGRPPRYWEGYLQPAGMLDGPLKVTPDRGRHYWAGAHPRDARVVLAIRRRDGATEEASVTVPLAPGWG